MPTANLVIGNGVSNNTIAVEDTTPMIQRAQDATADINASFGVTTFKVVWGFRIVAGFNDTIVHAANLNGTATNVTGTIAAGEYASGAALAAAIQTAMQAAEDAFPGGKRVNISVTYTGGNKFNWAWTEVRTTISQFFVRGVVDYTKTVLATVGIQMGADQVGAGANGNFDGDYTVLVNRFTFAFAGLAGSVRMADPAFTAESFFGITATTNKTIQSYTAELDMLDPPPPPPPTAMPARFQKTEIKPSVGRATPLRIVIPKCPEVPPEILNRGYRRGLRARAVAASEGEEAAAQWLREQAETDKGKRPSNERS
jgi:ribosomal protein S11